jgi:hypothetical protein
MQLTITPGPHNMPSLEFHNPSEALRQAVKREVLDNWRDSPAYLAKEHSSPFLQCDDESYVLIEFWGTQPQDFVDYLQGVLTEQGF